MQRDTLRQLYGVTAALAAPDDATLTSALRQINQFSYDLDRVAFVAKDEVALLGVSRFAPDPSGGRPAPASRSHAARR
ncbi:MAG TPA: hypothetical protein VFE60_28230 [Roseiarcus sp.]|jgi:hypothetical protein|nr:hypothetical protein [Roseiarcus sp.]